MIKYRNSDEPLISKNIYTSTINLEISALSNSNIEETNTNADTNANNNHEHNNSNGTPFNGAALTLNKNTEIRYSNKNMNFYASLEGLSGQALREGLFSIQKANRNKTGSYNDLFKTYEDAFVDKYYEKDGSVLDIYEENPQGKDTYIQWHGKYRDTGNAEGKGMNREHLIAQSWFSQQAPMRNDAHHVWPTDKKVNAWHGNYPYGTVKTPKIISVNGTKIGDSVEDGRPVAEVIDEFKGDVARAHLYFAFTYRDKNLYNNESANRFFVRNRLGLAEIKDKFKQTMLNWAKSDNISQFDIDRNNGIYKHQGNRNPFIDYPELIDVVFNGNNDFVFHNKGFATELVKK
ncbi:ribonuclease [Metamycoplasma neophronis]|uniref:Ribonuclease n=2 Tax=Metamycoplasma neophronis TaxID=872983 RepID=A0ABY2Z560_9BACT|nr:ribonuclease [Metamycoplasma neophronis]